jgi:hypothetical protein
MHHLGSCLVYSFKVLSEDSKEERAFRSALKKRIRLILIALLILAVCVLSLQPFAKRFSCRGGLFAPALSRTTCPVNRCGRITMEDESMAMASLILC